MGTEYTGTCFACEAPRAITPYFSLSSCPLCVFAGFRQLFSQRVLTQINAPPPRTSLGALSDGISSAPSGAEVTARGMTE